METFSEFHDPFIGVLVPDLGGDGVDTKTEWLIDTVVNVPSMPVIYGAAVGYETVNSGIKATKGAYNLFSRAAGAGVKATKGVYNFFTGGNKNVVNPSTGNFSIGANGGGKSSINK